MKSHPITLFPALLLGACLFTQPGEAQEQEFEVAQAMEEKRVEGITKLADRIQNFGFLDYARKLVDRLDKRERKVDPFGMAMDPQDTESVLAMPAETFDEIDAGPKTSLQEAVSKFRVTGVYPNRNEVIVGAQSLRVGDQVLIKHGDVSFNLKISKVEADSVELTDLETGEVAGVSLGIVQSIPQGMTRKQPLLAKDAATRESSTIIPMSRKQLTLDFSTEEESGLAPQFPRK